MTKPENNGWRLPLKATEEDEEVQEVTVSLDAAKGNKHGSFTLNRLRQEFSLVKLNSKACVSPLTPKEKLELLLPSLSCK